MDDYTGTFEMIDPRIVVVDHRYQRQEKPALVAAIATDPRWELFGVPVLFKRSSQFYCADGQQRIAGVKQSASPPLRIPAVWFEMAHLEDEAAVFVQINEFRKQLSGLEKHKGKIVARDPATLAIERAVEKAGMTIGSGNGRQEGGREISAVAALYDIYNQLGEDGVLQTLVIVRDAFPDDHGGVSGPILRLVSGIIVEMNGKYERSKLTTQLGRTTPARLMRQAESYKFEMGGSQRVNLRRAAKTLCKV